MISVTVSKKHDEPTCNMCRGDVQLCNLGMSSRVGANVSEFSQKKRTDQLVVNRLDNSYKSSHVEQGLQVLLAQVLPWQPSLHDIPTEGTRGANSKFSCLDSEQDMT